MRNPASTVLSSWFNEVWNNDDESAIDKLMQPDAVIHGIVAEGEPNGAEGFKKFFKDFKNQFRDIHIEVEDVVSQDDVETARTAVKAIDNGSGKMVNFSGICMAKIKEGKIAEAWNHYDFLNMHQQLGRKLV
jgi:predicted ester cyclase